MTLTTSLRFVVEQRFQLLHLVPGEAHEAAELGVRPQFDAGRMITGGGADCGAPGEAFPLWADGLEVDGRAAFRNRFHDLGIPLRHYSLEGVVAEFASRAEGGAAAIHHRE